MIEPHTPQEIRLNKHLALQLGVSRREADALIERGKVTVNGDVAPLGARIRNNDKVIVDGKHVGESTDKRYFALHKPVGYVCSRRRQGDNPTIYELLPSEFHTLKPVGRLDRESSGILLLTNDGDFAFEMTHPKFAKTKLYHVELDRPLQPLHQQMISDFGIQLPDGVSKFTVSRLESGSSATTAETTPVYEVTMHEGRNRQIRRTFAAMGYSVTRLHRVQFGGFSLGGLQPGAIIPITVTRGA